MSKPTKLYDPEYDMWTPIEGLQSSKFSGEALTAINYEGKLHMVSGRGVFKVGVVYDADLNRWVDMLHGMRIGCTGMVDGTLFAMDENMGWIRIYQSAGDTWCTLVQHTMLKGLKQVIAAPGSRICGIMEVLHGSCRDNDHFCHQDFVRIVHLSPSPADSGDSHVKCQLILIDIAPSAPNVTIVALQLLSSMLSPSPNLIRPISLLFIAWCSIKESR